MRARWVRRDPSPELPGIGSAIVATWWPGRYYKVQTIELDNNSAAAVLIQSLEQKVASSKVVPSPTRYISQVVRCTSDGVVDWPSSQLIYEREYQTATDARAGHEEIVKALEFGHPPPAKK